MNTGPKPNNGFVIVGIQLVIRALKFRFTHGGTYLK